MTPGQDWLRAPLVIGATGGSGTRALRKALVRCGVYMGTNVNESGDAMDFEPLLDQMINRVLALGHGLDYQVDALPSDLWDRFRRGFDAMLEWYLLDRQDDRPWGWKNPRSMFLLPLYARLFPDMRFIHLVRDGRDMALSSNVNQARKHGALALPAEDMKTDDMRLVSASLWRVANTDTADWGLRHLGNRYLCLRFEDLCTSPEASIEHVLEWMDLDTAPAAAAATAIHDPGSIGRWRDAAPDLQAELRRRAGPALIRFGYS